MKRVLLIDNYDSFTFNLLQAFKEIGAEVLVYKNDQIDAHKVAELNPDFLVFSPGPGDASNHSDIGNGIEIFEVFKDKIPILGVCLGHQMIGEFFGAKIKKITPAHGKKSEITLSGSKLFKDLPEKIEGMRYHSMVIDPENFPQDLSITAKTPDGHIMAIEKPNEQIYGLQFHPESIGTKDGLKILENFLNQ